MSNEKKSISSLVPQPLTPPVPVFQQPQSPISPVLSQSVPRVNPSLSTSISPNTRSLSDDFDGRPDVCENERMSESDDELGDLSHRLAQLSFKPTITEAEQKQIIDDIKLKASCFPNPLISEKSEAFRSHFHNLALRQKLDTKFVATLKGLDRLQVKIHQIDKAMDMDAEQALMAMRSFRRLSVEYVFYKRLLILNEQRCAFMKNITREKMEGLVKERQRVHDIKEAIRVAKDSVADDVEDWLH